MQNKKEKLNGKDFINIGIFTAIYMVIVIVIACTVGLIPIGFILLPIILPIIGGIPMMLYFTKVKKAGMLLIFEILFGLVMILTGMGYDLLIWGVVVGIICELLLKLPNIQVERWPLSAMVFYPPVSAGTTSTGFLPAKIGFLKQLSPMEILM